MENIINWQLLLEYTKVLSSWPPICLIMFTVVIRTFREPIATWIKNLRVKYGDTEFSSQAARRDDSEVEIAGAQVDQSPPSGKPENSNDATAQWRAAAYLWEYRYLNRYLVPHTQQFLDWIFGLKKPIAFGVADAFWNAKVPDPKERLAVIDALRQHYLIAVEDGSISITPKGEEYVQVRGAVPPAFPELDALANKSGE